MTTDVRRSLAAAGAASLLTALGTFATMQPASAMPADPGSGGVLSGNTVHAASGVDPVEGNVDVDPITEQEFNSHGNTEYGNNCDQFDAVKYCEYPLNQSEHGTRWDAYIAVPQGTTLDATVTIDLPDDLGDGNTTELTAPVHADSPYLHLGTGLSQWDKDDIQTNVTITLSDGSRYRASSRWTLSNSAYQGQTRLFPN